MAGFGGGDIVDLVGVGSVDNSVYGAQIILLISVTLLLLLHFYDYEY